MKTIEKLELLAESQNISISNNIGKHDVLKFILSRQSTKDIEEFYVDTFIMLEDEICEIFDEEIGEDEELSEEEKKQNALDDIGDMKYQQWKDEQC